MDGPADQTSKKVLVGCRVLPATADRLSELADEAGLSRQALAVALLEELVPTITNG